VPRLLELHEEAAAQGSTLVTGSGFGVFATEAVVVKLCENLPTRPPYELMLSPPWPPKRASWAPASPPPSSIP
jgi:hypothetical protein